MAAYEALLRALPVAVALLDAGGRVIAVNAQWSKTFGGSFDELARNMDEMYPDIAERMGIWKLDSAQRVKTAIHDLVAGRRYEFEEDLPVSIEGRNGWHRVTLTVLDPRKFAGVLATHMDVSERRQLRQEAERFVQIAAHDLQTPLRTIANYLQLLDRRYRGQLSVEADSYLAFAVRGAKRLSQQIQDLLTYARLGQQAESEPLDLAACAAEVLQGMEQLLTAAAAEVTVGHLPAIRGDRFHMVSLFQNLLENAVKFRHPARSPRVRISASRKGLVWEFVVSDNGIGIDPSCQERIFDLYSRLDPKDGEDGTGMGLAIARRIVERAGGRIWVISTVGEGTAFHFTLPGP